MKKDKVLYTCKSLLSENEYANMAVHYGFYKSNLLRGTIMNIIIVLIITLLILKNFIHGLIIFIGIEIVIAITYKLNLKENARKTYRMVAKKNKFQTEYINYFYKEYFVRKANPKNGNFEQKFKYEELDKIIETDNNFYLSVGKLVFIFQKEYLKKETISFLRDINKNIYINKLNKKSS